MSDRLNHLVAAARADRPAFDGARSLHAALAKKERRARRDRIVRRSVVGLTGAALFALLLFRASIAPASASAVSASASPESPRQEIAARALDDAGYACD
jgi:hypothetical protein